MKFNQNILPHLIALLVFILVTVAFYSPIVFESKTINQHDMIQGLGASQEIIDYRKQTGEEALWTNSIFGGMPAYLINMQWSGDLMLYVHRLLSLWLPSSAGVTLVGCITFYLLLLVFKVRPWLAIIGGLAYGLGSFNIISIEVGHMWKVWAIAYMPLVLAGVHLTIKGKHVPGFVLTALGLALELRSNHLQITYYLLLLLIIYGATYLVFAFREGEVNNLVKSVSVMIIAALLALGCNMGKIWSVYEYGEFSTRGPSDLTNTSGAGKGLDRDYVFRWSNGILEPVTLLIPNFFGGPSTSALPVNSNLGEALRSQGLPPVQVRQQVQQAYTYWGNQPITAGPSYAGAIVIFLFVLGYFVLDKKQLIWITVAIVLSIMLSWGHNFESFNNFMFDYFPGYSKFRSVSMTLVIALLCIPLAAFAGAEQLLLDLKKPETQKKLLKAAAITGGILLLAVVYSTIGSFRAPVDAQLSGQLPDWYLEALRADRASLLRSDAFRSLIFIALALTCLYFHMKAKLSAGVFLTFVGLLVMIDLWTVDKRYLTGDDFIRKGINTGVAPSDADLAISNDQDPNYRVLSFLQNPWAEARTAYFHKSIGGYHGAKLRRYQELIEGCLDNQYRGVLQQLQSGTNDWSDFGILNMLNTRYFLVGAEPNSVIRNNHALGHAWYVSEARIVKNADQELAETCQIDPGATAVIDDSKFNVSNERFTSSGNIVLEEYQPNYLRYQSENPDQALAVFSEIYYPKGWTATIDGEPAEIIRANYVLRALEIPGGSHLVEFRFQPAAYHMGNKIMMASSILLLLLCAGAGYVEFHGGLKR
jgi:hypothetical protein